MKTPADSCNRQPHDDAQAAAALLPLLYTDQLRAARLLGASVLLAANRDDHAA